MLTGTVEVIKFRFTIIFGKYVIFFNLFINELGYFIVCNWGGNTFHMSGAALANALLPLLIFLAMLSEMLPTN